MFVQLLHQLVAFQASQDQPWALGFYVVFCFDTWQIPDTSRYLDLKKIQGLTPRNALEAVLENDVLNMFKPSDVV